MIPNEAKTEATEYIKSDHHLKEDLLYFATVIADKYNCDPKELQDWMLEQDVAHKHSEHELKLDYSANPTDSANAEFFRDMYKFLLKYDHLRGRYLLQRKHYLEPDQKGEVYELAKEAARYRYQSVWNMRIDDKSKEKLAGFMLKSEDRARLEAILKLAGNMPPIAESGKNFDSDPLLLACENGVIDLRIGKLRDGKPEDNITMHSKVIWDDEAKCDFFILFFARIFNFNIEIMYWVWRYIGYTLTGLTTEEIWALCYGIGSNGKSRLFHILMYILSDYAWTAPFSTFESRDKNSVPSDLAMMFNKRLVTASENRPDSHLNEQRVKVLAGEDEITARFMHRDWFTFRPIAKLWLAVNHKPTVKDDTDGFWRKIRMIPFTEQFTDDGDENHKKDDQVDAKNEAEASGILRFWVLGCLEYQKYGLSDIPDAIKFSTKQYKNESNITGRMLFECCIPDKKPDELFESPNRIKASELYSKYKEWSASEGIKKDEIMTSTAFGNAMAAYPQYHKKHERDGCYYYGLRFRVEDDTTDENDTPIPNNNDTVLSQYKEDIILKCDGFLALCDGFLADLHSSQILNSHVRFNGKNLSQLITEIKTRHNTQAQNEAVTGFVTGPDNPSQPKKCNPPCNKCDQFQKIDGTYKCTNPEANQ